jgi:hypothetical protein
MPQRTFGYLEVQYAGTWTYVSSNDCLCHAETSRPSSKAQLRVHYVDCLPHDDSSLRAVACHRLLVAARHSACMRLSKPPILQLDYILVQNMAIPDDCRSITSAATYSQGQCITVKDESSVLPPIRRRRRSAESLAPFPWRLEGPAGPWQRPTPLPNTLHTPWSLRFLHSLESSRKRQRLPGITSLHAWAVETESLACGVARWADQAICFDYGLLSIITLSSPPGT